MTSLSKHNRKLTMQNILILGATGSLAAQIIPTLLAETDDNLTLFARNPSRLAQFNSERVQVVQGDMMNIEQLSEVLKGKDIVYAGLAGNLEPMAKNLVTAMETVQVKRLIWVSSMGIYGETGEDHGAILDPYRRSAQIIEQSGLDYTILRPGWFTNGQEIDYQLTHKGEAFKGHSVSRKSIADFVLKLMQNPELEIKQSVGIAKE
ncbi:NAD(P)H-binding protein [Basfia succiniciproducens]|uniref:NAD(P)H-binding protein n=1 Tax=Basfia succiniciproducens TaxID=653940 RepID=UPI003FCE5E62